MAWKFNNETPIYFQIMEEIKRQIAQGILQPGAQIPSVRELAVIAGVNPNTMQKALSELEREGVLISQRTSGRFVAESGGNVDSMKAELSRKYIVAFVSNIRELGYDNQAMLDRLSEYLEEEKK